MDRRTFLAASAATAGLSLAPPALAQGSKTRWVIRTSEGFDALGFLSPLSGDPFYLKHYEQEVAEFAPNLPAPILADIKQLKADLASKGQLLSPAFYLYFSGGPDATIEDLFESIEQPQRLRPAIEASPYWDADSWSRFIGLLPRLRPMLEALREAGFRDFRNRLIAPQAAVKLPHLRLKLAGYDVLKWAKFYTGREFEPTIELVLMHFSKPHGIKVIGQRFLNGIDYPDEIPIRNAGHEVLHPPVPMDGEAAKTVMAIFERDALLQRILTERDKSYGYGTIQGLFDEGLVKALDQLISECLGVAENPRQRWRTQDGGMHVLAAAFYGLMKQDGYARTGGDLEAWLLQKARGEELAPKALHAAAGQVLGYRADRLWPPPNS